MEPNASLIPSTRFGMLMLWFIGSMCFYMIRVNFSIAIVCMTLDPVKNDTAEISLNRTTITNVMTALNATGDQCTSTQRHIKETGEFEWNRKTRGLLSSAFYWGYLVTQIPGGYLAQQYGPKIVHFAGLAIATMASLLSPISAVGSPWILFAARFVVGLGCGVFVPATTALVNNWSPKYEKSIIYTTQASGYSVGSVMAFFICGTLCDSVGWQSTFYMPSAFMCGYLVLFMVFTTNTPEESKRISNKEKTFIRSQRGQPLDFAQAIPWRDIFTSTPCWALFISEFFSSWGGYMTVTSGAQYMKDVLKFDIKANGVFNALPQIVKCIMSILAGIIIDTIRRKQLLSTTNSRKLAETFGMLVPSILMVGLGFMGCDMRMIAVFMVCAADGFDGFGRAGISVNIMEVAPRYVAILVGILNTFSTAAGMISPIVVGLITTNGTQAEWQIVFYVGAGVYFAGWLIFVIFTDAEEQSWSKTPPISDKTESEAAAKIALTAKSEEIVA